jgi:hypothetical protein
MNDEIILENNKKEANHNTDNLALNTSINNSIDRLKVNQYNLRLRLFLGLLIILYLLIFYPNIFDGLKNYINTINLRFLKEFLKVHNGIKNTLIIMLTSSTDFIVIYTLVYFILFSKSYTFPISIVFYTFIFINLKSTYNKDYVTLWNNPGFPSFLLSYSNNKITNFESILGFIIICLCELKKYKCNVLVVFCYCLVFVHSEIIIILTYYSVVEVLLSIIVAHYSYFLSDQLNDLLLE